MGALAVIRSAPGSPELHAYVQEALRRLAPLCRLDAVFFMGEAAALCSRNHEQGSLRAGIRDGYAALGRECGARLLCCGSAFSELGISKDDVAPGFELAGNFELSALFSASSCTVEF